MTKMKLILIITILFLIGCKSHKLKNNIVNIIKSNSQDSFRIDLKNLINENWDSLYQFNEYSNCDKFRKYFSGDCNMPLVPDACRRYIFSYKGKVVYWEDIKFANTTQFYISNDSSKNNFVISMSQKYLIAKKIQDDMGTVFYTIHPNNQK
jgi:hypothetical protein